eukprot:c12477_g1_i3.p1 GENE.c12477_g1_i3~~c12477_g1_i3.p1  ORF type:complete len:376 (+),score=69.19 c12477_g1_i3:158-1285(+)
MSLIRSLARPTARRVFAVPNKSFSTDAPQSIRAPRKVPPTYKSIEDVPGEKKNMNMFTAINDALHIALESDPKAVIFGEDVGFGGVFRCTVDLQQKFGKDRVFNTPLCEQGIAGFAIGLAAHGHTAIAEIQFADYIFPAFDQIVNEAAKFRYRSGGMSHVGGLTFRAPCCAVGHGGHYHSQSPEAYFAHTPGVKVVMPSGPAEAKGLLLASIFDPNPVVFLEPKILYRLSEQPVPLGPYALPLGKAQRVRSGNDITIVGYGSQMRILELACDYVSGQFGVKVDLINLRSILPWDADMVEESVRRTGRLIVSHEAPQTCGFASEVIAEIQERCFLSLEAPPMRVCGYDTPFPLSHEKFYLPDELKVAEAVRKLINY